MSKLLHGGEYIRHHLGADRSKNSGWEFYHLAKYVGQHDCNRMNELEELMDSAGRRNDLVELVHALGDYSSSPFLGSTDRAKQEQGSVMGNTGTMLHSLYIVNMTELTARSEDVRATRTDVVESAIWNRKLPNIDTYG